MKSRDLHNQTQLAFDEALSDSSQLNPNSNESYYDNPTEFDSFPTSFVSDFERFVDYLTNHTVNLTKRKGHISRKHLQEINKLLTVKNNEATSYTDQEYYPYIHFFYYLAISGRLFEKVPAKAGKYVLKETDRLLLFKELNPLEKYFFLLETFWVDLNWNWVINELDTTYGVPVNKLFFELSRNNPCEQISIRGNFMLEDLGDKGFLLLYFEWFGLLKTKVDQWMMKTMGNKNDYFVESVILTDMGAKVIPLLLVERNLSLWNIEERKSNGEFNPIPGLNKEYIPFGLGMSRGVEDAILERMEKDQSDQPFYQPFSQLFPENILNNTLPRTKPTFMKGTYTLKVHYSKRAWREIKIAGTNTMDDLHYTIIQSFQFDDDHLYSFFMDGEKWSNNCIVSPFDDFGHAHADQIQIGEIGLEAGESFLYLYDYGDEWTFRITIKHYDENLMETEPYVIESKGEAPEQY